METLEQIADRVQQVLKDSHDRLLAESMLTHIEANRAIVASSQANIESHRLHNERSKYRCADDRNFVAQVAMQGLLAGGEYANRGHALALAEHAYEIADAMLLEARKHL